MKLKLVLISTHALSAAAGCALVLAASGSGLLWISLASGLALAGAATLGMCSAIFLQHVLGKVCSSVTQQDSQSASVGIQEFDKILSGLRELSQRWNDSALRSRQESREILNLVTALDRRGHEAASAGQESATSQLKKVVSGMFHAVNEDLDHLTAQLADIEKFAQQIRQTTESQGETVNKSVTYVEQMSIRVDSVSTSSTGVRKATQSAAQSAQAARGCVRDLIRSMESLKSRSERSERKLRVLGERSRQISSIVESIGAISSRTDLLALNASIESIRAGELGRGFSVVAEEVRKLADQTAKAAQEVSALVDSIQSDTNDSILGLAEQVEQLSSESQRVRETDEHLSLIEQSCEQSTGHVRDILQIAEQQLQLSQDLVMAMEHISDSSRENRSRAEETNFTTRNVLKLASKVHQRMDPLRQLGSSSGGHGLNPMPSSPGSRTSSQDLDQILSSVGSASEVDRALSGGPRK